MLVPLTFPSDMAEKLKFDYQFIVNALSYLEDKGYSEQNYSQFVKDHEYHQLRNCSLLTKEAEHLKNHLLKFQVTFPCSAVRNIIIQVWKDDLQFERRWKISGFLLSFTTEGLHPDLKETVKTYFVDFYKAFFKLEDSNQKNYRSLFRNEFAQLNESYRHICSACLGRLDIDKAQLDHYFPVHYFPALTLHPYNLVPICASCNTAIGSKETKGKGGNIPGEEAKQGMFRELLFPYKRSGYRKIRVEFTGSAGQRKARLTAITKAKHLLLTQVENHAKLYNLDPEWSRRLPYLYERLAQQMIRDLKVFQGHRPLPKTIGTKGITLFEIRSYFRDFIIRGSESQLFRLPDQFLYVSFVIWLYKNEGPLKAFRADLIKRMKNVQKSSDKQLPYIWREYVQA